MAFKLLSKVLAGSGAEKLSATSLKCAQAMVQSKRSNTHAIEIGDGTLATGTGIELVKPVTDAMLPSISLSATGVGNPMDLSTLYAIGTAGEGLNILYEEF